MISARMLRSMACLAWHEFPLVLPAMCGEGIRMATTGARGWGGLSG